MEEAIFQGTTGRRPVNRGAVSLAVSNEDGALPIPFEEVGVLAGLAAPLAAAGVSVLAVATHDTDWLLVPARDVERAAAALAASGCVIIQADAPASD